MTSQITENKTPEGLVESIVAIVCAVIGFFIPFLGLLLAIVALVLGVRSFKIGQRTGNQTVIILGLIAALVSGIALVFSALATLAVIGLVGGLGFGLAGLG